MGRIQLLCMTALSMVGVLARCNSLQPSNITPPIRIVGGGDVPSGEYVPYQVSLQYLTSEGYRHYCGGSIIAPDRILTAAHCCADFNVTRMSIVAGIRNLDDQRGSRSQVLSYAIHPDYQELVTSDIAVLNIDPPLVFNDVSVAAIDYADEEFVGGGVSVTLTGWGLRLPVPLPILDSVNYPNTLQRMTYNTITNQECRNRGMEDVTETEICARGVFRGACSGDSGGPLVRNNNGLKQVGVVSYGLVVCGVFIVPDVYTRVSTFRQWIQQHVETTA
ncbi:chymotrypsin-1 [Drosophila grimshawi]|uniref:GH15444 n=1 Tax=Drosophila grimshawi TaxID=7222 RepID=B4JUM6_DROGR|nr:chymotrypsin-1 [Drosophila grimshawi]EDV91196.1 GH15444 [Drosophila grimshawi]